MKILKIVGGLIAIIGACITLTSPFLLLIGIGTIEIDPDTFSGIDLTETTGIILAVIAFIIGAIIAIFGKILWDRD